MWTVDKVICLLFLIIVALRDIRIKEISTCALVFGGLLSIGYQVLVGEMDCWLVFGGVIVGVVFLLFSKITREGKDMETVSLF